MPGLYVPDEILPIYPTYSTVEIDGKKYKAYFETDWHQVKTEDGVSLCELLQSMPSINDLNMFNYKGILKNRPDMSAMDQLYALTDQKTGDVYLVETDFICESGRVCELYVWCGNESGWIYCGTTDKKSEVTQYLPDAVKLFPDDLGNPGQILLIDESGKKITWGDSLTKKELDDHNLDKSAHKDIRNDINLKASKLVIFNDEILASDWVYNSEYPCFDYIYTNENIPIGAYFELVPIINSDNDASEISKYGISSVFEIISSTDSPSYAILRSKRVPDKNISICIKVYGEFETK